MTNYDSCRTVLTLLNGSSGQYND